jgi:hypothetical protein
MEDGLVVSNIRADEAESKENRSVIESSEGDNTAVKFGGEDRKRHDREGARGEGMTEEAGRTESRCERR